MTCFVNMNRPKELKIPRGMFIPKKGLVYDHVYLQRTYGSWHTWSSMVTACNIDQKGKVGIVVDTFDTVITFLGFPNLLPV